MVLEEAGITGSLALSYADNIDAKMETMRELLANVPEGEILSGGDSTVCLNRTSADRVYKKYEKDDIVTLTIDDIGTNGEGIGRTEGITLLSRTLCRETWFVPKS